MHMYMYRYPIDNLAYEHIVRIIYGQFVLYFESVHSFHGNSILCTNFRRTKSHLSEENEHVL